MKEDCRLRIKIISEIKTQKALKNRITIGENALLKMDIIKLHQ